MTVIAWITEGTWPTCVDAARTYAPESAEIVLLHVTEPEVPGAYAGLLGRARPEHDPGTAVERLAAASAEQFLTEAAVWLGRLCTCRERSGRVEHEVVAAADGADPLVLVRDGDRTHLGPPQPRPHQPLHRRPRPLPRPARVARACTQHGYPPAPPPHPPYHR